MSNKGKRLNVTPEERKRRSDRAKSLNREGKLGGSRYGKLGGRPKSKDLSTALIAAGDENADQITDALLSPLAKGQPVEVRARAAERIVKLHRGERELAQEPERELTRDEAVRTIARGLQHAVLGSSMRSLLDDVLARRELPEVVDAEAVSESEQAA